jgi:DNA sulfur modification protein DndB
MNLYPALIAKMGNWHYYVVKMKMKDLAKEVNFASEVHNDATLDEAIQRELSESRAKGSIVDYLARRKDRFFSSIVVAALGGNATFYPVSISDNPTFQIFSDQGIDQSFGVLTFDGSQAYYALDGQHRLKAIKTILDPTEDANMRCPKGFQDEEISVIVVLKRKEDSEAEFRRVYRRLFSSLNRYAKATNLDTNIIMDEDDAFAIITRRLITDYKFFSAPGRQRESFKVLTKGKNLKANSPHFTSLQTLYQMNQVLLSSSEREGEGWGSGREKQKDVDDFITFRPDEEYIDELYEEVNLYWDALLQAIPALKNDPLKMRVHEEDSEDADAQDHVLFWPIGQEMVARLARRLLNRAELGSKPAKAYIKTALEPLGKVNWDLHSAPWRYLVLTQNPDGIWRMRSEDRKPAIAVAENLLIWILGVIDHTKDEIAELKETWYALLIPPPEPKEALALWDRIEEMRRSNSGK